MEWTNTTIRVEMDTHNEEEHENWMTKSGKVAHEE